MNIKETFKEKNQEIFRKKLKLDLLSNSDALKKNMNNVIKKTIYTLEKEISNMLEEKNLTYDDKELQKMLKEFFCDLKEINEKTINQRTEIFERSLTNNNEIYYSKLKDLSKEFNNLYETSMKKAFQQIELVIREKYSKIKTNFLLKSQYLALINKEKMEEEFRLNNLKNFYKSSSKYLANLNKKVLKDMEE